MPLTPPTRRLGLKGCSQTLFAFCSATLTIERIYLFTTLSNQVSLAQLGERQTEVSVTKSGGIVYVFTYKHLLFAQS
jgi:hypothetical protein